MELEAPIVNDIEEWVHLEKELLEDEVAVLLVHIPSFVYALLVFDSFPEDIFSILVIDNLQLGMGEDFVGFTDLMEPFHVDGHVRGIL